MTRTSELQNVVKVKLGLAAKYERLARGASSKPRKAVLFRRAERYRRQAEDARRVH